MSGEGKYALVILIGPPGSGKSHLGRQLASRGVARFTEMEPVLMARFGTGEAFAANKDAALQFVEESYKAALAVGGAPLAIESTGASERAMLERLAGKHRTAFVRLDIDREVCVARVAAREQGRNFSNAPEHARQLHDFWTNNVAPAYHFDLVVETEDSEAAVAAIAALLA